MIQRKTILGISPGSRSIGIAVFQRGDLIEYQVKTFTGKLSSKKIQKILKTIKRVIEDYEITSIGMKIPEGKVRLKEMKKMLNDIEKIANIKDIPLIKYTISFLKTSIMPGAKTNKQKLAQHLMQKYPEVSFVEHTGLNRHTYYGKMFEAIAAGMQLNMKL